MPRHIVAGKTTKYLGTLDKLINEYSSLAPWLGEQIKPLAPDVVNTSVAEVVIGSQSASGQLRDLKV
ncbi:hypothetical protein EVAR_98739_1 [Eumeta japonica]|uniref:Uncharacterized protein n=1 Tax=Eumeta variegata TaxID=151549 RepID=A0A4C1YYB1_EUMVA|nr:hypothetical protein EVAR_98739_1 [Eumeta japonica]